MMELGDQAAVLPLRRGSAVSRVPSGNGLFEPQTPPERQGQAVRHVPDGMLCGVE